MKLLEVHDLHTYFQVGGKVLKAVDGVDFQLDEKETLGFVGESGCGKTTTALSVLRLLPKNGKIVEGSVLFQGEDILKRTKQGVRNMRWKEISIIFQGAMNALNPVMTVSDQIAEAILLHDDLSPEEARQKVKRLFEMVEIETSRMNNYPHEFSGGMRQRAMIAMALACGPKIVIGDEPTTALDVVVQAQIFELIEKLQKELGMSMILITHDLSVLADTCDRGAVMYAGKIVECGTVDDLFYHAAHPYTQLLLASYPRIGEERVMAKSIPGVVPNLFDPPAGCRFCDRCPIATEQCAKEEPQMTVLSATHTAACHRVVNSNE